MICQTINISRWDIEGYPILISLQSFDIDSESRSIHLLYNQLGIIYDYDENDTIDIEGKTVSTAFLKMQTTNYELPLTQKEREELVRDIMEHIDKLKE